MGQIILQFCSFDSLASRIITWGTQGTVGHVDIVLPSWHLHAGDLLGAQHTGGLGGMPEGVQIRPSDYGDSCGMIGKRRVILKCSDLCEIKSYEWAESMIGSPYDLEAIEGIVLNEDRSNHGHLICSGYATGMLTQPSTSFLPHQLVKPWRIVTPEELMLICSAFAEVTTL